MAGGTNLTIKARMAVDPRAVTTKSGKLICNFAVVYDSNKKAGISKPVFISMCCIVDSLSEYIMQHYSKGAFIHITKASPSVDNYKKTGFDAGVKFLVWEIDDGQGSEVSNETISPDAAKDDDIPY